MKTDALFYQVFQFDPQALFQLMQLPVEGEYTYESITIKTTEKRMDGFFKRIDGEGPNFFLEVQGYPDSKIYWRFSREICTYHEQREEIRPFVAIVIFVDKKYDPGPCPLSFNPPHRLIIANLEDCLKGAGGTSGVLTVLKPLTLPNQEKLTAATDQWIREIDSLKLPDEKVKILLELLEYAILQRFPELTLEEIRTMLQLTPLDKTVAGQELIQMGKEEGRKEGQAQGELIGEIRVMQRGLKQTVSPREELASKNTEELQAILKQLKK